MCFAITVFKSMPGIISIAVDRRSTLAVLAGYRWSTPSLDEGLMSLEKCVFMRAGSIDSGKQAGIST